MHSIPRGRAALAAVLTVAAACSAAASYYGMLAGFSSWDDEGNLMMTVRQFLDGGTLYRNISTGYGPLYYFFNWLVRSVTATNATHDATRVTAAAIWTVCSFAAGWIVWRFGRSLPAAAVAFALTFRALRFFRNEPGHPQEFCMILLLGTAAAFSWCDDERTGRRALAIAGAFAAALLLVKINIGIFIALAIALAVLGHMPKQWLYGGALLAAVALPAALMRGNAFDPRETAYAILTTAGIAALVVRPATRHRMLSWRDATAACGGFCVLLAGGLALCVFRGITLPSMVDALALQQWRIRVAQLKFFVPATIDGRWLLFTAAILLLAVWVRAKAPDVRRLSAFIGAAGLLAAAFPGNHAIAVIAPCCWLLPFRGVKGSLGLTLLATAATLQTLYAYPVAGSQVPFANVLLIIVAAVMASDLARAPAIAAAALLITPVWAWQEKRHYESLTPLDLPGATLVRVEARQAAEYQWATRMLRRNCDTFVGYPGMPSFYAWTGKPMPGPADAPPGPLSTDSWNVWLTSAEQETVVADFSQHPNACVLYNPAGVAFWNRSGADETRQPLVRFVREHFRTVDRMGNFQFQVRNERSWLPTQVP